MRGLALLQTPAKKSSVSGTTNTLQYAADQGVTTAQTHKSVEKNLPELEIL